LGPRGGLDPKERLDRARSALESARRVWVRVIEVGPDTDGVLELTREEITALRMQVDRLHPTAPGETIEGLDIKVEVDPPAGGLLAASALNGTVRRAFRGALPEIWAAVTLMRLRDASAHLVRAGTEVHGTALECGALGSDGVLEEWRVLLVKTDCDRLSEIGPAPNARDLLGRFLGAATAEDASLRWDAVAQQFRLGPSAKPLFRRFVEERSGEGGGGHPRRR
jgi:hypothetical protein